MSVGKEGKAKLLDSFWTEGCAVCKAITDINERDGLSEIQQISFLFGAKGRGRGQEGRVRPIKS